MAGAVQVLTLYAAMMVPAANREKCVTMMLVEDVYAHVSYMHAHWKIIQVQTGMYKYNNIYNNIIACRSIHTLVMPGGIKVYHTMKTTLFK